MTQPENKSVAADTVACDFARVEVFRPEWITPPAVALGTGCNGDRAARWTPPLVSAMRSFGILGREQCAMLLAQLAHESGRFRRVVEDLDYSAQRLVEVWPKRFDAAKAYRYQHRPEELANLVYGGRLGNTQPGDGWRYRGRGLVQITGRDNYRAAGAALGVDLELEPALASTTDVAARLACWFFAVRADCLEPAAEGDVKTVTKRINGGTTGLDDRARLYAACMRALSGG
jgi:putative chitinase